MMDLVVSCGVVRGWGGVNASAGTDGLTCV